MYGPDEVGAAAAYLRERLRETPRVGLVLGSGLGAVAELVGSPVRVAYADIPHWPVAGVEGHAGELFSGRIGGRPVAVLSGRAHLYEGFAPAQLALPVRVLAALGCRELIVTNAAGALNPELGVGDLVLIDDHLNLPGLSGANPLAGPAGAAFGPRFVNLRDAYDPGLRALAARVARELGEPVRRGVYAMVSGPSYETPAELRFLRLAGGDAVGMSSCPEVLAARQAGLRVLGVSCITNLALPDEGAGPQHREVLDVGARTGPRLAALLRAVLAAWEDDDS